MALICQVEGQLRESHVAGIYDTQGTQLENRLFLVDLDLLREVGFELIGVLYIWGRCRVS
jgi:hypothetical protein